MADPQDKSNKGIWWILGVVVIVVALAAGVWVLHAVYRPAEGAAQETPSQPEITVRVTPAESRLFTRRLGLQGTLQAETYANVSPRIPGTIEAIRVEEGDAVEAGRTVLFEIDRLKLEKAVQLRRLDQAVAACGVRQAEANLEKVQADFHKAELDLRRFERLFASKAVTADALEQQQSRHAQLKAALKLAQANVDLTTEQHKQARTALDIAEKDLADAVIAAPISGVVAMRFQEPGEMGSPGVPVLRIEDVSTVRVSAFLPGEYYGQVQPGRTRVRLTVGGRNVGDWPIYYRSPTIDPRLRTFEIRARVDVPEPGVVPGAVARVEVLLEEREGAGVPSVAVQQRGGGDVVFVVRDGRAQEVPVTLGIEEDDWVEVVEGDVAAGDSIVTMGQERVKDGLRVTITREDR